MITTNLRIAQKKGKKWQATVHTRNNKYSELIEIIRGKVCTFVPKSVSAIAILFFAISKLGEIVKHLQHSKITTGAFQDVIIAVNYLGILEYLIN